MVQPVHVISLCSYAGFDKGSLQYEWLQSDLASINSTATPWVVGMWHTPWYTSNAHHPRSEGADMMAVCVYVVCVRMHAVCAFARVCVGEMST